MNKRICINGVLYEAVSSLRNSSLHESLEVKLGHQVTRREGLQYGIEDFDKFPDGSGPFIYLNEYYDEDELPVTVVSVLYWFRNHPQIILYNSFDKKENFYIDSVDPGNYWTINFSNDDLDDAAETFNEICTAMKREINPATIAKRFGMR